MQSECGHHKLLGSLDTCEHPAHFMILFQFSFVIIDGNGDRCYPSMISRPCSNNGAKECKQKRSRDIVGPYS